MFPSQLRASALIRIAVVSSALAGLGTAAHAQGQLITLDGSGGGRIFEGIGAVSSGGSSRLLIDYPEPYRGQILDYLFKPNYGASLQSLKIEIGGDEDSGGGSEPTHMRSLTDQNYTRGYEWWLMQQAKLRNPNIKLQALAWGAPGWVGDGKFYSQDNINYIINFIQGAKNTYGLTIDYIGTWNESPYNTTWIKNLKSALQANGLTTQLVAADQSTGSGWYIVNDMFSDSALMSAVDVIGEHYVGYNSTYYAKLTGKPLWASEDGPWRGDWTGATRLAKIYNHNYIDGKMTMTEIWSLVSAFYDIFPLAGSGLMYANTPWSGFYDVQPAIWATAHTTQFIQPGWQYIDNSSGYLTNGGTYVALKSGSDYSVVIENVDAWGPQDATFTIAGGLSTGTVHVWKTDATTQFAQQSDIAPVNGSFTIHLVPGSMYSLTTTTGQTKGNATAASPAAFPFPFSETFDSYTPGQTPKYFSAINGAFEATNCAAGRSGMCLRQVVTTPPIPWGTAGPAEPASFAGAVSWASYQVSADVLLEQPGTAKLIGRLTQQNQTSGGVTAYQFYVSDTGAWSLRIGNWQVLSSGTVPFSLNTWHSMKLILDGARIQGVIDGVTVASIPDNTYGNGMAGLGVSGWTSAQFDNFRVDPVPGVNIIPQSQMTASATSQAVGYEASRAIDGNTATFWHTAYICDPTCRPAVLPPHSITLNLGGTYNISKLRYLPRQDGDPNGTITSYNIYLSTDGTNFTLATSGLWADDPSEKSVLFPSISASYVRLEALAGRAGYASASEINVEYGGTSPTPVTSGLSPGSATAGGSAFTLAVTGSNFVNGSVVRWNGSDRSTTFSSSTSLAASIPAADIATAGTANITVFNPAGGTSNAQTFVIASGVGTVPGAAFVTAVTPGTPRNNYAGWVGMSVTVGTAPLVVSSLGRMSLSGNAASHTVKIVDAATGADLPGGAVTVGMAGTATGNFVYGGLPGPLTLGAHATYYILSQEAQGGDSWYDLNTTVQTAGDAAVNGPVYGSASTYAAGSGMSGHVYVPVDFKYTVSTLLHVSPAAASLFASQNQQFTADAAVSWSITPSTAGSISGNGLFIAPATIPNQQTVTVTATSLADSTKSASAVLTLLPARTTFVSSTGLGTSRNNYAGWVGMSVTTGSAPLLVNSLGRMFAAGNTGSHVMKIVNAGTGADVAGSAVTIPMTGGTQGSFVYAALPSPLTLDANTTYYVLSQEAAGGDSWYDLNTLVQTSSDAVLNGPVYGDASLFRTISGMAGYMYVPVDFGYTLAAATPSFSPAPNTYAGPQSVVISTATAGASIRYTTDGSAPSSTVGIVYGGPVLVSGNLTLKAIAYKNGMTDSAVVSGDYIISLPVATPTFAPPAATYTSPQSVTISTATAGATIRYTTDGSAPSSTVGIVYGGPVLVSGNLTLKAIAYKAGMTDSLVSSASYVIAVVVSNTAAFVKTDTATQGNWMGTYGAQGYNVIDDTVAYPGYVTVTPANQLNYIWANSTADARGLQKALSSTDRIAATWYTSASYTIDVNFNDGVQHQVAIYCLDWDTAGGRAFTISVLDGTTNAVLDSQNISSYQAGKYLVWNLSGHVILQVNNTGAPNATISGLFFDPPFNSSPVATPTFAPPPATYSSPQSVTITTITAGASIRYTTDGTTPTSAVGTVYSVPVPVASSMTLKAIAFKAGMTNSAVSSASYVITAAVSNAAAFVKTDTATQGNWKGTYGAQGYNVIDDTVSYPGYVTVTPASQLNYVWASLTMDARGLQKALSSTDRIAATWYTSGSFTVDLNFNDTAQHQVAIYCLDWDTAGGRAQTISVLDGTTNAVLDSQNVGSFQNGKYLVWNLTGHVIFQVTNTGSPNATIGGLFFDPAASASTSSKSSGGK